ncbi:unnamed protein product [Lampetra fluviatilis]
MNAVRADGRTPEEASATEKGAVKSARGAVDAPSILLERRGTIDRLHAATLSHGSRLRGPAVRRLTHQARRHHLLLIPIPATMSSVLSESRPRCHVQLRHNEPRHAGQSHHLSSNRVAICSDRTAAAPPSIPDSAQSMAANSWCLIVPPVGSERGGLAPPHPSCAPPIGAASASRRRRL